MTRFSIEEPPLEGEEPEGDNEMPEPPDMGDDPPVEAYEERGISVIPKRAEDAPIASVMERSASFDTGYQQVPGVLVLTDEQQKILRAPIPDADIDVKPSGELFMSQTRYRRIFSDAFGVGAWGLRPVGPPTREQEPTPHVSQEWALFVTGRFVSQAWGEQDFVMGTNQLTYATALEGAKSTALTRCAKDLNIASELWDRHYTEKWKAENCVQVWVEGKKTPQWRRKDAPPFYKETGFVNAPASASGSPRTAPQAQTQARAPEKAPAPPGGGIRIAEVIPKTFTKRDGSEGRSWVVLDSNGVKYETVLPSLGKAAGDACSSGAAVRIESEPNGNYPRKLQRVEVIS